MTRRSLVSALALAPLLALAVACTKSEERCSFCGMKVPPTSAWRVVEPATKRTFDTPRCAFGARLEAKVRVGPLEMRDHYDRTAHAEGELRFVAGSDVIGPMGPDLVPVMPEMVPKFSKDHGSSGVYRESEITRAILDAATR